ncbi:hypothetical protein ABW19_dt0206314 [Dactylella cylindrospora]|nr:hypothetical protein ABW19_dt0206314 [Dactylella cylindrospora]
MRLKAWARSRYGKKNTPILGEDSPSSDEEDSLSSDEEDSSLSDEDSSSDEKDSSSSSEEDDDEIISLEARAAAAEKKQKLISYNLNLAETYVQDWEPQHGYREFVQNWYDGICESFGIQNFHIVEKSTPRVKLYIAQSSTRVGDPGADVYGFLRYTEEYGKRGGGVIELANFKAYIPLPSLTMGHSSKHGSKKSIGGHGEGFKTGALALLRGQYFTEIFTVLEIGAQDRLTEGNLSLRPTKRKKLRAYPDIDILVRIGKPTERKRGDGSVEVIRRRVSKQAFNEFLEQVLFFEKFGEGERFQTPEGSLLLGKQYINKTFLKGILLASSYRTRKLNPCRVGYDLKEGETNRDRAHVSGSDESVALSRCLIWNHVLDNQIDYLSHLENPEKDSLMTQYLLMILEGEAPPDVKGAEKYTAKSVAEKLMGTLFALNPGTYPYWCDADEVANNEDLIIRSLKLKPFKISKTFYNILRGHKLLKTPQEERERRFEHARPVEEPSGVFADHLIHDIKMVLSQYPEHKNLNLQFVDHDDYDMELLCILDRDVILMNKHLLSIERAHRDDKGCRVWIRYTDSHNGNDIEDFAEYYCDHAAESLVRMIRKEAAQEKLEERNLELPSNIRNALREMPKNLRLSPANTSELGLLIEWEEVRLVCTNEQYTPDMKVDIAIHTERCWEGLKSSLYSGRPETESLDADVSGSQLQFTCDCSYIEAEHSSKGIEYTEIKEDETYIAVIRKKSSNISFWSLPSSPLTATRIVRTRATTEDNHRPSVLDTDVRCISPVNEEEVDSRNENENEHEHGTTVGESPTSARRLSSRHLQPTVEDCPEDDGGFLPAPTATDPRQAGSGEIKTRRRNSIPIIFTSDADDDMQESGVGFQVYSDNLSNISSSATISGGGASPEAAPEDNATSYEGAMRDDATPRRRQVTPHTSSPPVSLLRSISSTRPHGSADMTPHAPRPTSTAFAEASASTASVTHNGMVPALSPPATDHPIRPSPTLVTELITHRYAPGDIEQTTQARKIMIEYENGFSVGVPCDLAAKVDQVKVFAGKVHDDYLEWNNSIVDMRGEREREEQRRSGTEDGGLTPPRAKRPRIT